MGGPGKADRKRWPDGCGKGERTLVSVNGESRPEQTGPQPARGPAPDEQRPAGERPLGAQPSRVDKRLYFVLMTICIGLFVLAWAVVDRYSVVAAVVISAVALVIPPFAAIVANATSASRRRDE